MRVYWVHLVFAGIVLLGHLQFWWLFWSSRTVESWSFFAFIFLLLQPIALYLLADLCFPDTMDAGRIDLKEFYFSNRLPFFALLAVLMSLIIVRDTLAGAAPRVSAGMAVQVAVLLVAVTGAIVRSQRVHAVLAVLAAGAMLTGLYVFGLQLN